MPEASVWVAIVDDDPSVLKALARLLRTRAVHCKIYNSAQEFLATLPDGLPDCLVLDLHMPEMTGMDLHEHLARMGIRIPTIVITAHGGDKVRERLESAGVVAVLAKPLRNTALLAAIKDARTRARS
jgi:FixJ family two-component response regulator